MDVVATGVMRNPVAATASELPHATPAKAQGPAPAADKPVTSADKKAAEVVKAPATDVVVAWHAASLGYVTRVVDSTSGTVFMQTPPEQVLHMVERVLKRIEGANAW